MQNTTESEDDSTISITLTEGDHESTGEGSDSGSEAPILDNASKSITESIEMTVYTEPQRP